MDIVERSELIARLEAWGDVEQEIGHVSKADDFHGAATEITRLREENKVLREAMLHIEDCATDPVSVTAAIDAIRVTSMVANHKAALATTGGE